MKSMAASSTSILSPPPPHCTPIEEGNEDDEEFSQGRNSNFRASSSTPSEYKHKPTPLHSRGSKKRDENDSVLWNKCRPSHREKFSIVPLENSNGIFKSVLSSLVKKTPKSENGTVSREEQWRIAAAELSNKLVQATRKRDDAVLESAKLKRSMSELEKKLKKLEIYCHNLKSEFEVSGDSKSISKSPVNYIKVGDRDKVIEHFLVQVSGSRTTIRALTRALTRLMGGKVYDRMSLLLQPYDVKGSFSRNPRALLLHTEALLNRVFFEDFESGGFHKSAPNRILNPIDQCESNFAMFSKLQGLTWDEVLIKGTRHFSEDFSKFCDRKMSEIVAMLGWTRAWPEPLLQAFFGASKAVWLVHLLANSVHPSLPIFRVENGSGFDPVYMEDMDRVQKMVPMVVRVMVTPGFYVYDNAVKCKVICRYYNNNNGSSDKGLTPSPS